MALVGVAMITLLTLVHGANAQSMTVLPVTIRLPPGQMAAVLNVINPGDGELAVQIRSFAWSQVDGRDQLTACDDVMTSPPIAVIAAHATQVIRLVLRKTPQGREATYRILLDQIPPPASPNTIRIALRLSIPVFAEPPTHVAPNLRFHLENGTDKTYLVAVNDGGSHDVVRDIILTTGDGRGLATGANDSPYVLAGDIRRWQILTPRRLPTGSDTFHLTARAEEGPVDQRIHLVAPP